MTPEQAHPTRFHDLEIHTLRVASDAKLQIEASVLCPRQQRSMRVDDCRRCERFLGFSDWTAPSESLHLVADEDPRASALVCDALSSEARSAKDEGLTNVASVGNVMSKGVFCVRELSSLTAVAHLLVEEAIDGAPVIDENSRPVGVVSKTDLIRALEDGVVSANGRIFAGATVNDVMTPFVITVDQGASLQQAAELMLSKGIHRLPVVSADGVILGIVSSSDALRWFAEHHRPEAPEPGRHAVAQTTTALSPGDEDAYDVTPISLRAIMMELLWVCGDCGAHYPHKRECPQSCDACGAPRQNFYAPIED